MTEATRITVVALEPYAAPSHVAFLRGLKAHSRHAWTVLTLPPRKWKWRMRTSAIHFAGMLAQMPRPDLLFASDYLNLAEMNAILPESRRGIPTILYFHENQLTYPLQQHERRDFHYGLTHLYAILAAERTLFNSRYHREQFLGALESLFKLVPDVGMERTMEIVRGRTSVMPLGIGTFPGRAGFPAVEGAPLILWNHRWEYDKRPEAFLEGLRYLVDHGCDFRVRILGQRFRNEHPVLDAMRALLGPRLHDAGFPKDRGLYQRLVAECDIVVSTAIHEFFGLGALEAIRAGVFPVLPNDLAYPELLPEEFRGGDGPFLYPFGEGVGPALLRALETVRTGALGEERMRLQRGTERFGWRTLIREYDAMIDLQVEARV